VATTETLYYYQVTYNATTGTVTKDGTGTGTQVTISTPTTLLTYQSTAVYDQTTGTTNTYIGTVLINGVNGYLVEATSGPGAGNYYVFMVSKPATFPTTAQTVHVSTTTSPTSYTNWNAGTGSPACFMAGTAVRTPTGDVLVENLRIGDQLVLADGTTAPVSWVGRSTVHTRFADPLRALPIRIKQDALGEGVPARDLLISPDHALFLDGILVQAGAMINGTTIVREEDVPEIFTYYHVEVADHSLILAENVPAETFVDNVNRMAFDNWEEHRTLFGDNQQIPEMQHPRAKSARQLPPALRARLGLSNATAGREAA
jgi:hypothetical protein